MQKTPKKLTLDDLAVQLRMSKFSISRALRGGKGVSDTTREFVLKAVRELGYDHLALREPAPGTARQIRLIIPRDDAIESPYWINVIGGAEAAARRIGFALVTVMAEDGCDMGWEATRPSGIILAGRRARGRLEAYLTLDIPMVLIGYPRPGEAIDAVHVANWESGVLIGRHLRALGHTRLAYLTDEPHDEPRAEKLRGCRDAFADLPGAQIREVVFYPERETELGVLAERMLGGAPAPTAIVCASDVMTIKAMLALGERGLRLPDDISLVGSNNSTKAMKIAPNVTSISAPMQDVGSTAIELLQRRFELGRQPVQRRIALTSQLVIRASTGPPSHLMAAPAP